MIRYSIIIVNYKTPQLVIDCIDSIYKGTLLSETEIIVVDNDSNDNSEQQILSVHPNITWINMDYNSGFARANNAGIQASKGAIVLLLNSDTLNEDDAIAKCFRRFEKDDCIAAGVQLLNADRTPQISGNYVLTGGLNYLMALPYVGRLIRKIGLSSGVKKTNIANATSTADVDWINGAFLMVKKSAIEKAGYLDKDFFLYSEEAEWCSRLKKIGTLRIYGGLHVVHLEGGSSSEAYNSQTKGYQNLSDKKGFQIMLSNFVRFRKEFGVFWYLFHLVANLLTIPIYLLVVTIKTLFFTKGISAEWKLWKGYTTNVFRSLQYFFSYYSTSHTFIKCYKLLMMLVIQSILA
ncbi:glycosyltransferase family 2 protein [Niabella ginsengisoli]|uniref:Glycosyltransferase family 2 protein n=1 Tax=Niabella ginsengisoli TaxID=522298 RepID=A0ABS9SEP2_9BACT|nr:glycosyltransferase family 2 protein [Niabella ginsengisoli]MCH5596832.1 glycosyltransferase family 2 protein [Niabella ginsengisoli]